jgi:hypothetical protein
MIEGLDKRGGAEKVSPPTRDAPVRKRTCAATSTNLPNLSTFCLCLPLPCMLPTAMHVRTFRHCRFRSIYSSPSWFDVGGLSGGLMSLVLEHISQWINGKRDTRRCVDVIFFCLQTTLSSFQQPLPACHHAVDSTRLNLTGIHSTFLSLKLLVTIGKTSTQGKYSMHFSTLRLGASILVHFRARLLPCPAVWLEGSPTDSKESRCSSSDLSGWLLRAVQWRSGTQLPPWFVVVQVLLFQVEHLQCPLLWGGQ